MSFITRPNVTRRNLLRHAGFAALFAPFLTTLENKPARAANGKANYLLVFFTNGTDPAAWKPGGGDGNISFSAMTEPLSAIKSGLILLDNFNSFGSASNHASPGGLTGLNHGAPTHISIEQFVSDGLRKAGIRTQVPNLVLGGVPNEALSTFYRAGKAIAPIASPSSAYSAVFSGGEPVAGGDEPAAGPSAGEIRLRRRKSVLDAMTRELNLLQKELANSPHELDKLGRHVDSIRQLEERIAAQGAPEGEEVQVIKPVSCSKGSAGSAATPLENSAIHLDIAVSALACDVTRVAAVQFGHHQSTQVSIAEVGAPGDWHNTFFHSDGPPRTRLVNLERWLCKQFVRAAEKLQATPAPDGAGTLWDQTIMLWARDMGDAIVHDGSNMRFVIAGGAGGYLKHAGGGRYLQGGGAHHQSVLLSVIQAMGITDFTGFGDTGQSRMPFAALSA